MLRAGVPPWSQGQPSPEIQRQRVVVSVQRYQRRIEFREVVNEPSHLAEPKDIVVTLTASTNR